MHRTQTARCQVEQDVRLRKLSDVLMGLSLANQRIRTSQICRSRFVPIPMFFFLTTAHFVPTRCAFKQQDHFARAPPVSSNSLSQEDFDTHTYTHTYTHIHTRTHTHTHIDLCTHTCAHARVCPTARPNLPLSSAGAARLVHLMVLTL